MASDNHWSQGDVSDDDFLGFVQQASAGAVAEAVQDATADMPSTLASPDVSSPVSRCPSATGAPAVAASSPYDDPTPHIPLARLFRVDRKYQSVPEFMSDGPRFLSSRRYGTQALAEESSPPGDLAVSCHRPLPRKRTGHRAFPSTPDHNSGKQTFESAEDVRSSSPESLHQALEAATAMGAPRLQTDEIPHGHGALFSERAEHAPSAAAAPSVDEKLLIKALDWNRMHSETQKMQRENYEIRRCLQQDRKQVTRTNEENARLRSVMETLSHDNDILRDAIQGQREMPKHDLPQAIHSDQVLKLRHENTELHEEIFRLKAALHDPHSAGQNRGISMDGASNREACITLVLATDFNKAGTEGTDERKTFEAILVHDLSVAASMPKENFHVRGIRPGSIVVEVAIRKSAGSDARSAIAVARDLERQAYAPASKLCAGTLTRYIDVIMVSLGEDFEGCRSSKSQSNIGTMLQPLWRLQRQVLQGYAQTGGRQKLCFEQAVGPLCKGISRRAWPACGTQ